MSISISPFRGLHHPFPQFQLKAESVPELFQQYDKSGFLYPAKKKFLRPHMGRIRTNWKKALAANDQLLWVFSQHDQQTDAFASIALWKQSNHGLLAQHLVASGHPRLSLRVMLAAQYRAQYLCEANLIHSGQNWFRPDNRQAFRLFASMISKLGPKQSSLSIFQHLHLSLDRIQPVASDHLLLEEVSGIDRFFIRFVRSEYGQVFVEAEELNRDDIQLSHLGRTYRRYGLLRSRKILKVTDRNSGRVIGAIIANRGPLGANFSFLENRAYLLTAFELSESRRAEVCRLLCEGVRDTYQDFPLGSIPIVTNELNSKCLQSFGASFIREYVQSIWLRDGFSAWYNHLESMLRQSAQGNTIN